ncbi:MAG: NusG domain II-containing protein [Clostridia bacterium]|nr:NusG domain II-containing protein [Clostridia bacterium]
MLKLSKKGDLIILITVLAAAVASCAVFFIPQKSGGTVVITQNDRIVYKNSVYVNKTVELGDNTVLIKDGKVKMQSAGCKNQICVRHKAISRKGESIICLPNKVIAEIR